MVQISASTHILFFSQFLFEIFLFLRCGYSLEAPGEALLTSIPTIYVCVEKLIKILISLLLFIVMLKINLINIWLSLLLFIVYA